MRKPVVGETLFLAFAWKDAGGVPCTVRKVGRKYFYVEDSGWRSLRFCIDSWREAVGFGVAENMLFESEQEYLSELRRDKLTCILIKRLKGRKFCLGQILGAFTALGLSFSHEEDIEDKMDKLGK